MSTWKELRNELNISKEDENIIELEKELIRAIVNIREEKGWTQLELAEKCNVKQPVISRLEKDIHSPRVDSLLRVLTAMGYTLKIVPYK